MITDETKAYCQGYEERLQRSTGDDVADMFDRFDNLYLIYGRLFQEVRKNYLAEGKTIPNIHQDGVQAVELVVDFIGGDKLLDNLAAKDLGGEIEVIRDLLEFGGYNFCFNSRGEHKRQEELILAEKLTTGTPNEKAIALLRANYCIRCNKQHQRKHYGEDQTLLLSTLNRINRAICDQLYRELEGETSMAQQGG